MQCSLTLYPQGLSPVLQNPQYTISPFLKDQLDIAQKTGIAEAFDVTEQKKIHFVFNREIRKLLESYHRYGDSVDDTEHPYNSERRDFYAKVTGRMSVLTTYAKNCKELRGVLVDFIHAKLGEFQTEWQQITYKHVNQWIAQGHVYIGKSIANLLTEMVAATVLGFEGDCEPITSTFEELMDGGPCISVAQYNLEQDKGFVEKKLKWLKDAVSMVPIIATKLNAYRKLHSIIHKAAEDVVQKGSSKYVTFMREKGISDQAIKDNFVTMLIAGESTIASLITFALQEYISHPDLQDLDRQEVREKMQISDDIDYINHLEGPKKMLLETLRLYPPGGSTRIMRHDAILKYGDKEHYFHKGDELTNYSAATGRAPNMWKNPDVFDRDRPGLESMSHLPFGSGFHSCPGKKAVIPEALIVLSTILQNAQVYAVDPMPELIGQLTLKPEKDYLVGFRKNV